MEPELFNELMQSIQEADAMMDKDQAKTKMTKRNPQQEMYELSKGMPILQSQLATWCADMDALQEEVLNQAVVIVTQVEQLNQADLENERLTDINNTLRKEIQRLNTAISDMTME